MDQILRGSIILAVGNLSVRTIGHFYRILMGRMLPPPEFGVLNLVLSVQYLGMMLSSSGIAPAIAKFTAEESAKKNYEKRNMMISSSFFYFTLGGAFLGTIFYFSSQIIPEELSLPLKISALALPFGFSIAVFTGTFQGLLKMSRVAMILVSQQFLRIGFAIPLVFICASATYAILGSTIGFAVALLIAYAFFKKMGIRLGTIKFDYFKDVFYFSVPISFATFLFFVLAYADILLLGFFLSSHDVGIYSAASPTSRLILAFSMALCAVLIPSVSRLKATGNFQKIKERTFSSYKILFFVLVPVVAISVCFSDPIICFLFGDEYSGASKPFEILVLGTAFLSLYSVNSGILQGLGRPEELVKILAITAILDISLNFFLIPKFGIIGAAIASATSFCFVGIVSTMLIIKMKAGIAL
jgi:stage V sporulation protein B